ncbi:MAG: hypothetical protein ACREJN_05205, partial [Nitrospiraceae bacterium]
LEWASCRRGKGRSVRWMNGRAQHLTMSLLCKCVVLLKESWVRRRGQLLNRVLHATGPAFVLELGLAVLVLDGADRGKLLKRIDYHIVNPDRICF